MNFYIQPVRRGRKYWFRLRYLGNKKICSFSQGTDKRTRDHAVGLLVADTGYKVADQKVLRERRPSRAGL